ncbi:MAG TPA: hypothetical protein VF195_08710 [Actinomycetota bacterium]
MSRDPVLRDARGRHLDEPAARAIHALFVGNGQAADGTFCFWDPLVAALAIEPDPAS